LRTLSTIGVSRSAQSLGAPAPLAPNGRQFNRVFCAGLHSR